MREDQYLPSGWRRFDLQLFAGEGPGGEKTERPTARRKAKAREEGSVVRSNDLAVAALLLAVALALRFLAPYLFEEIKNHFINTTRSMSKAQVTIGGTREALLAMGAVIFRASAPIMGLLAVVGVAINLAQVGFVFNPRLMRFKITNIIKPNPFSFLRRIVFSRRSAFELFKTAAKLSVIGYLAWGVIWANRERLVLTVDMDVGESFAFLAHLSYQILLRTAIAMLVIGIIDYLYQRWEHQEELKMTKQEVKEEHKMMEGDPLIRARIRERQREVATTRMMRQVPEADVVITNPTHYAAALKYESASMKAPTVVAKGKGLIALRIREIAEENDVPIVENKPLARTLYEMVEIGKEIPAELYQAVAEILAYVYRLKKKVAA
jgi:flagellar biosynthetic protein FlhB